MWDTITFLFSLIKGLCLGSTVYVLGQLMDNTISESSKQAIMESKPKIYVRAQQYVQINLLGITPIIYALVDQTFLTSSFTWQPWHFMGILLTQNIGYFFVHKEMHERKGWYWMHCFHHKFDTIVIPSISNAVHPCEFLCAYASPIVIAALLFTPTEITYLSSIGLISILNLCIHTQEWGNIYWVPGLVSPSNHIEHHEVRTKHYAAPLFHIDSWHVQVASTGMSAS